jgi:predicted TIM-barrel fold metal-dependent hydrolase
MSTVKSPQGIDTHAHVFSAEAPAVTGARYRPAYGADLTAWRALWEASGITHGVLVQPSFFGSDNREMLETLSSDPRHLRGVAVLSPIVADDATLGRFHRAGVRAIRLNLKGAVDYGEYASVSWRRLFERVHELGWHVEVFVDAGRLPEVEPAFKGTRIAVVFDHFGNPGAGAATSEATFDAARRLMAEREVWVKLAAPYRLEGAEPRALAQRWLETVGPRHLVWGSDWPWTRHEAGVEYARLRAMLDDWIDASLRPAVLWDNAARLYQFA